MYLREVRQAAGRARARTRPLEGHGTAAGLELERHK